MTKQDTLDKRQQQSTMIEDALHLSGFSRAELSIHLGYDQAMLRQVRKLRRSLPNYIVEKLNILIKRY